MNEKELWKLIYNYWENISRNVLIQTNCVLKGGAFSNFEENITHIIDTIKLRIFILGFQKL